MIPVTTFAGKKVAVFGLGGSGRVSASALLAGGADVIGWDDNAEIVAQAASASITEMIQNRITICGSVQPFCSK